MNVLVTGGAGYIGSHTIRLLQNCGYRVVAFDSLEFGQRAALGKVPLILGSTTNSALVEHVLREEHIDAVIHFAAYKAAGESMEQPARYFANNTGGTFSLLDAMVRADVRTLVFSSTAAVYGTPTTLPVVEDHPLQPENPYGESKLLVERMLPWFATSHGLNSVVLRYFNAAGAAWDGSIGEDWTHACNLVPVVIKAALRRGPPLKVFGTDYPTPDGTAVRDYIHVLDLASAHVKALEYLVRTRQTNVFNLGTGQGSSVREVINATQAYSGVTVPVEYVARRSGDPIAVWADNSKARAVLGWEPRYGLEDIVATAWNWHSAHPDGYSTPSTESTKLQHEFAVAGLS